MFESAGRFFRKATVVTASFLLASTIESIGQQASLLKAEKGVIQPLRIETRSDQNMPPGFRRDQIVGLENGQEITVGSIFWLEDEKVRAWFYTNANHPDLFTPQIDYSKINQNIQSHGGETVVAFAGAYESAKNPGMIEGVAIENGVNVGSSLYSKSGFVYVTPSGKIEMYRFRDEQSGMVDTIEANALVKRAQLERGSLFQQLPAIWDGVERLNTTNQQKFEWRAICQTKDGKKFVLNCTEKITLRDFLILALNLKDDKGNQLVDDLMMTDTGVYSYGIFRDANQVHDKNAFNTHTMVDENYAHNKVGYTNVVVLGTK